MDKNKAVALTRDFYLKTQEYFNRSRQHHWQGWDKLLPHLRSRTSQAPLTVLDLGCGNGRFGKWLARHRQINYTGLDDNQYLLDVAAKILPDAKLLRADILKPLPISGHFDLVTILGVMHHLSQPDRLPLIRRAATRLAPKGILFLSFWEFTRAHDSKIIKDLGDYDYLLDWQMGVTAERYCHFYPDEEIAGLVQGSDLTVSADFCADTSNRYLLLSLK
jgi:2-polyprenyl-3-methyl-5-hydroxy-6-metoxy-1,4-benzoquinol methylase